MSKSQLATPPSTPVTDRPLPLLIAILVGWFGIATIEGVVLLATWAAFGAVYGTCGADCPATLIDALIAHRASPELFRASVENTGIAAAIVGVLALLYRKRAALVVRIALLTGGLVCALFGALFLFFAFRSDDMLAEIAASAVWMAVGVGALQVRHWMLKAAARPSMTESAKG